jgi:hypothetical protein
VGWVAPIQMQLPIYRVPRGHDPHPSPVQPVPNVNAAIPKQHFSFVLSRRLNRPPLTQLAAPLNMSTRLPAINPPSVPKKNAGGGHTFMGARAAIPGRDCFAIICSLSQHQPRFTAYTTHRSYWFGPPIPMPTEAHAPANFSTR